MMSMLPGQFDDDDDDFGPNLPPGSHVAAVEAARLACLSFGRTALPIESALPGNPNHSRIIRPKSSPQQ